MTKKITAYDFLTILFLILLFPLLTSNTIDGDVYWHIKTGEWIFSHQELPKVDPFSYMTPAMNSLRIETILQGYWLSQILFYGIWTVTGIKGIVIFRAIILLTILIISYFWLRKEHGGAISLATIFLIGNIVVQFAIDRPTFFSFLFTSLTLIIMDKSTKRNSSDSNLIFLMPFIMLIWCNTHGAYLLGVVLLLTYLFSDFASRFLKKQPLFNFKSLVVIVCSILLSFVNPNGIRNILMQFNTNKYYQDYVFESRSPIYLLTEMSFHNTYYWVLIFGITAILLYKAKTIPIDRLLTLSALLILSLLAYRHIIFIALAAPLVVGYIPKFRQNRIQYFIGFFVICIWGANNSYAAVFDYNQNNKFFPSKAVQFLNQTKPQGRIFNNYDWGAYLIMHAPDYKVFTDSRGLVEEHVAMQDAILRGDQWQKAFDYFNINTVIIPGTRTFYQQANQLTRELSYNAPNWHLVYFDETACVFVRETQINTAIINSYSMPKVKILEHFKLRYSWQISESKLKYFAIREYPSN